MVTGLLSGLRVLDLTRFVSGSQATMLLAAMGADVVKIEVPPGDPYRWQSTGRVGGDEPGGERRRGRRGVVGRWLRR